MGKIIDDAIEQRAKEQAASSEPSFRTGFVERERDVLHERNFIFLKLSRERVGVGILRPKNLERESRGMTYKVQECKPVIIFYDVSQEQAGQIELDKNFQSWVEKIFIISIPDASQHPRRWELEDLTQFLKEPKVTLTLAQAYEQIKQTYKDYCYFDDDMWYNVHALWDIATYYFLLFDYFPIFELRGSMATGKTKIMGISRLFSFNPTHEMTSPSEATLFREGGKTQYLDECEKIFMRNPKTGLMEQDVRAEIINSGFKATGRVPRQEKLGNKFITVNYATYSPRMLASISGLHGATEDRAIIHVTSPAPKTDDRPEKQPRADNEEYQKIRNELYKNLLTRASEAESMYHELACRGLKQREADIWKPVLAIAKMIDEELYLALLEFAKSQVTIKQDWKIEEGSLKYHVIQKSLSYLEDNGAPLVVKKITESLPQQFEKVKPRTVSKILSDDLGLHDYHKRTMQGVTYEIGYTLFLERVQRYFPNILSSLSSLSSLYREKDTAENMTKHDEEAVLNDDKP